MRPEVELAARVVPTPHPRPRPSLPKQPAPGSNGAYGSAEENARLVAAAIVMGPGLGRFDKLSFDDAHRMAARLSRRP